jgi:hypothetical protein
MSAVSGQGVTEAMRALYAMIKADRAANAPALEAVDWAP